MRLHKLLASLLCLTANVLLTETVYADRRTGLGGNLLIQDPDDLFAFPQYTLMHRNMIRLDYGASDSSGNGVLTLGNERSAYGIALHRGDLLSPEFVRFDTELVWLGGVGNPFGATGAIGQFEGPQVGTVPAGSVLPATVFDVVYGRTLGPNDSVGMRLGFGRGVQSVNVDGEVAKGQQTFLAAQLGYSLLPPEGLRIDLSGDVVFAFGSSTALGPGGQQMDVNNGTDVRLGLLGRGYYPINDLVDFGFIANVSFENEHAKNDPTDASANDFSFGLLAAIGPALTLERGVIAAYGGVVLGAGKTQPNSEVDGDEESRLAFAVPTVNMAVEVQVLDWLYVRTAAQYNWNLDRTKTGDPDVKSRVGTGSFIWTAGLGLAKAGFAFDVVVKNEFVTDGPQFIGGNADGFLTIASLTYKFGDVFSRSMSSEAETVPPPAAVPAAPPSEPVEPAPPPPPPPPPIEGSVPPITTG